MRCVVCGGPEDTVMRMCDSCQRSYDRRVQRDDGTIFSVLIWAAARARRAERARLRVEAVDQAVREREKLEASERLSKLFNLAELFKGVDPFHPEGRCTCMGEGRCAWCRTICQTCDGTGRVPVDDGKRAPVRTDFSAPLEAGMRLAVPASPSTAWRAEGTRVVFPGGWAHAVDEMGAKLIVLEHNRTARAAAKTPPAPAYEADGQCQCTYRTAAETVRCVLHHDHDGSCCFEPWKGGEP